MLCGPLALQSSHKVACMSDTQHKYSKFIDITSFCKCPLGFEAQLSQNGTTSLLCKHLFCYRPIDNDDLPRTMALPKSPHNSAPQKICPPWEHWPYKRTKFTVDHPWDIMIPLWRWYSQACSRFETCHSLNTKLCTLYSWFISSVCGTSEAFSKWDSK